MNKRILWADDEIDLLKPHILFLTDKGYEITGVHSGADALDEIARSPFDIVFLDEHMPGMTGLETLASIKSSHPNIPVVMITKNEEEHIMEEAIGSKIADYLIKPLNPNQILLSVKKLLDNERIVTEKTNLDYQQEFGRLSMRVNEATTYDEWAQIYKELIQWEMKIDATEEKSMSEILHMQKSEANNQFENYIMGNYEDWVNRPGSESPLLSHQVLKERIFPDLPDTRTALIVIDNLRYDQWEMIEPEITKLFEIESKDHYYSILPTTTAYARNALFSGMMPGDLAKRHPSYWVGEDEEGPKNNFESELLEENIKRNQVDVRYSYHKIIHARDGKKLADHADQLMGNGLNVIVYNFVDMLSHARTDMEMIKELAPDESAYRELTLTWYNHSSLRDTLKKLAVAGVKVVITTDHGTIRVKNPVRITGDRKTNTNLRFKLGKNLNFDEKQVFFTRKPDVFRLPKVNISTTYAFAAGDSYFVYPNNYNHFVNHFRDTFQHGGISMEEIIIPLVTLRGK